MIAKTWVLYFTIGAAVVGTAVRADVLSVGGGVSLGGMAGHHDPILPEDPDLGGDGDVVPIGEDPDMGGIGEEPILGEGPDLGHPTGADDQFEVPPLVGGNLIDLLGGHRRPVACFARNLRGQIFEAMDAREHRALARAMASCERVSHRCLPIGCQRLF